MSYNYRRPPSPRLNNPGRASDNSLTDPYYSQRHSAYTSPRSSGVIPISTQTFVNIPPPSTTASTINGSNSRAEPRHDSYSGRPRRSSLVDTNRGSASTLQLPSRSRPTIIQQDLARPSSPSKPAQPAQPPRDYYVMPASSQEPRTNVSTHKKVYSVDDGGAKLVADVNIPVQAGGERQHKRRDSMERSGYRTAGAERDRGTRGYYTNGTHNRPREKSIEDEDAYSYTDPAAMYKETEPRWRETRPRRGSMDRSGAVTRDRPMSMLEPTYTARQTAKEVGPPPSTRGWDRINEIGRPRNAREGAREVAQSPTRGRPSQETAAYLDPRDLYYVPPRISSMDRRTTSHSNEVYENDIREPRQPERRHSTHRDSRADKSVERRGFGIRTDFRNESQTRQAGRDGRGSDDSFEQARYRDSMYAEPHRRDTAPTFSQQDISRLEPEKRDRETAQRVQNEEYGRVRHRGYSDARDYSQEPKRLDDDRGYGRDYDRPQDRERDHERDRSRADRERERHHHRRDTDRDRDYNRTDPSPRQSGENVAKPGLGQVATGGLGAAAAALGLSGLLNKVSDKRDKDDYQDRDRDRDRDRERSRERERERQRSDRKERKGGEDRETARERRQVTSDEPAQERVERDQHREADAGLGFAYEAQQQPPSASSTNTEWNQERQPERSQPSQDKQPQDRNQDRAGQSESDKERAYDPKPYESKQPLDMPAPPVDPDEDYRRRMEQVQRELGRTSEDQRGSDSDADRERRRREREQRQRERESRNGAPSASVESSFNDQQSVRDDLSSYASTISTDLKRKPSILDRPMTDEPDQMAQVIDNSYSDKRENRVRIVDPPTEEEDRRPKGILKKPTQKFPEDMNAVREGVAPLKDSTKKGIPPGARWTKIDRRLVNPEALEAAHERFEERLDCVIVLRVLTKEEIQKLADRTRELRDRRFEEEQAERKAARQSDRSRDRRERDEYEYSDSEDEFKPKQPKMLEAPSSTAGPSSNADFSRENRDWRNEREREPESSYMSGGLGRKDQPQTRY